MGSLLGEGDVNIGAGLFVGDVKNFYSIQKSLRVCYNR